MDRWGWTSVVSCGVCGRLGKLRRCCSAALGLARGDGTWRVQCACLYCTAACRFPVLSPWPDQPETQPLRKPSEVRMCVPLGKPAGSPSNARAPLGCTCCSATKSTSSGDLKSQACQSIEQAHTLPPARASAFIPPFWASKSWDAARSTAASLACRCRCCCRRCSPPGCRVGCSCQHSGVYRAAPSQPALAAP